MLAVLESKIERFLGSEMEKMGGKSIKLNSQGLNGFPDRTCLLPGGRIFFVELKAPGKKPRKLQKAVGRMLERLGFKVYVIDSKEKVLELVREYEI